VNNNGVLSHVKKLGCAVDWVRGSGEVYMLLTASAREVKVFQQKAGVR